MSHLDILIKNGKNYFEQRRDNLAVEEFRKALVIDPDNGEAHFELGKMYYIQKRHSLAIDELQKVKRLCAQNLPSHLLLAKIYKEMRKFDSALEEIKYALDDPVHSFEAKNELSDIYPEYIAEIKSLNFYGDFERALERAEGIYDLILQDDVFCRNKLLSEIEIGQRKLILDSKMRNLIVTLSTRCNLNCIMCEEIRLHWEIPRAMLQEIISVFPYLERIVWQGGEVFLLDYFGELLERASEFPNLRQVITTNGLLIDEKWAEKLVKNNVDLTFSIDGITKDVYEKIRKGAHFEVLIRNLCNFNELRRRYSPSLNINLHMVVMKSNYHQLEDYLDFAKEYGFKLLALLPIGGNYNSPENIFHFKDAEALGFIKKVIPKIRKNAGEYGILLENRLPIDTEEKGSKIVDVELEKSSSRCRERLLCHLPWIQLYIDYDGTIRPDCVCRPEKMVGHASRNSLMEVWNNEAMQLYRKKILNSTYGDICNSECTEGWVSERYLKFS